MPFSIFSILSVVTYSRYLLELRSLIGFFEFATSDLGEIFNVKCQLDLLQITLSRSLHLTFSLSHVFNDTRTTATTTREPLERLALSFLENDLTVTLSDSSPSISIQLKRHSKRKSEHNNHNQETVRINTTNDHFKSFLPQTPPLQLPTLVTYLANPPYQSRPLPKLYRMRFREEEEKVDISKGKNKRKMLL